MTLAKKYTEHDNEERLNLKGMDNRDDSPTHRDPADPTSEIKARW